ILKLARRCRSAVVIGGGITALEIVEGLAARGVQVHYFLRGDRYWADVLDETESRIVMDRLRHEGVILHTQTQIQQALGANGQLTGVETTTGEQVPCQMLAVAIGVKPRTDLAREAGLQVDKGIVVDPQLRTSVADVFAAGDVAEVHDPRGGPPLRDVLWPTALQQGQVAGANLAGAGEQYLKNVPLNVTQLTGLKVTIIGCVGTTKGGEAPKDRDLQTIARGESETWRLLPSNWVLSEREDVNRVRLVLGDNRIIGALVMGDQSWSRPLQHLVTGQADITPIRAALHGDGPAALQHLAGFYRQWRALSTRPGGMMAGGS
ncbi:MAG: FAD-dependent oxidoreductase, partial [Planctomycetia bacterium]|nr:FAD-dependent oxidoreductase [Planctomycetia bacterium]